MSTELTCGKFADEAASAARFDQLIESTECFRINREVYGTYLSSRIKTEQKGARIDRILLPNQKLIGLGWELGPIGVEIKASGCELGKVVTQCLDYTKAAWHLPLGYNVVPEWIFIWPAHSQTCAISSVMNNHRIGVCHEGHNLTLLTFVAASTNVLFFGADGRVSIKHPNCGAKVGSR